MTLRLLICFSLAYSFCLGASVTGAITVSTQSKSAGAGDRSGVVIWLQPTQETVPLASVTGKEFRMVQKRKQFSPHILAIPVGASVAFPNFDPIFHNAFSNYNGQIFDVGLYAPGSSRSVTFRREGIVRIFCNIHSSMSAVIVALKTPYFAQSKEDGSFVIEDVPPGVYRMLFYYERATEQTLAALTRTVEVGNGQLSAGTVSIS